MSFPESGTLISGGNTISYTNKSVNQFFECTGITSAVTKSSNIRSSDTYFSYENGDTSKKVELLILGIISKLNEESENFKTSEDIITIKKILEIKLKIMVQTGKKFFCEFINIQY